jgi:hypothetical protein
MEELQRLLDGEGQTSETRTAKQDNGVLSLACASLALTVDDMIKVFVTIQ